MIYLYTCVSEHHATLIRKASSCTGWKLTWRPRNRQCTESERLWSSLPLDFPLNSSLKAQRSMWKTRQEDCKSKKQCLTPCNNVINTVIFHASNFRIVIFEISFLMQFKVKILEILIIKLQLKRSDIKKIFLYKLWSNPQQEGLLLLTNGKK